MRRGGHRQDRAAIDDASSSDDALAQGHDAATAAGVSPCENGLLYRWAWGRLHATDVQATAHDVFLEGVRHPSVMKLASMGAFGQSPQHIHTQLVLYASKQTCMPPVDILGVPVINRSSDLEEQVTAQCGCYNLHDWVSHSHSSYPTDFERAFNVKSAESFWDQQDLSDPKLQGHPMLLVADWKKKFVPYNIYADGA